jgi:hypothetical protein
MVRCDRSGNRRSIAEKTTCTEPKADRLYASPLLGNCFWFCLIGRFRTEVGIAPRILRVARIHGQCEGSRPERGPAQVSSDIEKTALNNGRITFQKWPLRAFPAFRLSSMLREHDWKP